MTIRISQSILANALAAAWVTAMGNNAIAEVYNGAVPASTSTTPAGTLLATLTFSGAFGTVGGGSNVIDVNETITQTNTNHVSGTPTFVRFKTAGSATVMDIDIGGGAFQIALSGTVVNGQNVNFLAPCTITLPLSVTSQA